MKKITTVGIDLAKNVFSLHGVDETGRVALSRTVRRDKLTEAVVNGGPSRRPISWHGASGSSVPPRVRRKHP